MSTLSRLEFVVISDFCTDSKSNVGLPEAIGIIGGI